MTGMTFTGILEKSQSGAVIRLPFDPNEAWGSRERHHIAGTIHGIAYRGPVQSKDGYYYLSVGAAWLRDAKIALGTQVEVVIAPEGRQVEDMPEDIAAALSANPQARAFFESLPTFYRKNYLRWLDSAKQTQTRTARIQELVRLLAAGQRQR